MAGHFTSKRPIPGLVPAPFYSPAPPPRQRSPAARCTPQRPDCPSAQHIQRSTLPDERLRTQTFFLAVMCLLFLPRATSTEDSQLRHCNFLPRPHSTLPSALHAACGHTADPLRSGRFACASVPFLRVECGKSPLPTLFNRHTPGSICGDLWRKGECDGRSSALTCMNWALACPWSDQISHFEDQDR